MEVVIIIIIIITRILVRAVRRRVVNVHTRLAEARELHVQRAHNGAGLNNNNNNVVVVVVRG